MNSTLVPAEQVHFLSSASPVYRPVCLNGKAVSTERYASQAYPFFNVS